MNLIEAQKTIAEMEADQQAAPANVETPDTEGQDAEGQTALSLLREISASLKELVTALAAEPEPEEPELPEEAEPGEEVLVPEPTEEETSEEEFGGEDVPEEAAMRRRPAPMGMR